MTEKEQIIFNALERLEWAARGLYEMSEPIVDSGKTASDNFWWHQLAEALKELDEVGGQDDKAD